MFEINSRGIITKALNSLERKGFCAPKLAIECIYICDIMSFIKSLESRGVS